MDRQEELWLFHLESPARPMELGQYWHLCLPVTGWGRAMEGHWGATLSRGQLLLTPPGRLPRMEFETGSQWYQVFFTPALIGKAAEKIRLDLSQAPMLLRLTQEGQNRLSMLLGALAEEESNQEEYAAQARSALLELVMVEISRGLHRHAHPSGGGNLIPMVLDYIEEHYGEPLTLDQLAGVFYVSKYYLSHLFSQKTGMSLFRYLQQKRLMEARQLLAQGASPSEACQRCGFGDYANFYRAFKEQFGQSPRAFSEKKS